MGHLAQVDPISYNAAITSCQRANEWCMALELFDVMKIESLGVRPDDIKLTCQESEVIHLDRKIHD